MAPDGSAYVTGVRDGKIKVWSWEHKTIGTISGVSTVDSLAVMPGAIRVAAGCRGVDEVHFWNLETRKRILLRGHQGAVRVVAFSPDGRYLASGGSDQSVRIWDAKSGVAVHAWRGHTAPVTALVWQPDSQGLYSGCARGEVRQWLLEATAEGSQTWRGIEHAYALSPGGDKIVGFSRTNREVLVADVEDGENLIRREVFEAGSGEEERALCFAFGQKRVVLLSQLPPNGKYHRGGRLLQLDAETLEPVGVELAFDEGKLGGLAVSPDGRRAVVTGSGEEPLQIFDLESGERLAAWGNGSRRTLGDPKFSPDGRLVMARDWNERTLEVFEADGAEHLASLPVGRSTRQVVSQDGRMVAVGIEDNTIELWSLESLTRLATLSGHLYPPTRLMFSPDSKILFSSAGLGALRLWHLPTFRQIGELEQADSVQELFYSEAANAVVIPRYGNRTELWHIPTLGEIDARGQLFGEAE